MTEHGRPTGADDNADRAWVHALGLAWEAFQAGTTPVGAVVLSPGGPSSPLGAEDGMSLAAPTASWPVPTSLTPRSTPLPNSTPAATGTTTAFSPPSNRAGCAQCRHPGHRRGRDLRSPRPLRWDCHDAVRLPADSTTPTDRVRATSRCPRGARLAVARGVAHGAGHRRARGRRTLQSAARTHRLRPLGTPTSSSRQREPTIRTHLRWHRRLPGEAPAKLKRLLR